MRSCCYKNTFGKCHFYHIGLFIVLLFAACTKSDPIYTGPYSIEVSGGNTNRDTIVFKTNAPTVSDLIFDYGDGFLDLMISGNTRRHRFNLPGTYKVRIYNRHDLATALGELDMYVRFYGSPPNFIPSSGVRNFRVLKRISTLFNWDTTYRDINFIVLDSFTNAFEGDTLHLGYTSSYNQEYWLAGKTSSERYGSFVISFTDTAHYSLSYSRVKMENSTSYTYNYYFSNY